MPDTASLSLSQLIEKHFKNSSPFEHYQLIKLDPIADSLTELGVDLLPKLQELDALLPEYSSKMSQPDLDKYQNARAEFDCRALWLADLAKYDVEEAKAYALVLSRIWRGNMSEYSNKLSELVSSQKKLESRGVTRQLFVTAYDRLLTYNQEHAEQMPLFSLESGLELYNGLLQLARNKTQAGYAAALTELGFADLDEANVLNALLDKLFEVYQQNPNGYSGYVNSVNTRLIRVANTDGDKLVCYNILAEMLDISGIAAADDDQFSKIEGLLAKIAGTQTRYEQVRKELEGFKRIKNKIGARVSEEEATSFEIKASRLYDEYEMARPLLGQHSDYSLTAFLKNYVQGMDLKTVLTIRDKLGDNSRSDSIFTYAIRMYGDIITKTGDALYATAVMNAGINNLFKTVSEETATNLVVIANSSPITKASVILLLNSGHKIDDYKSKQTCATWQFIANATAGTLPGYSGRFDFGPEQIEVVTNYRHWDRIWKLQPAMQLAYIDSIAPFPRG
ncbi:MAG: hypothetical protein V1859_06995 [archaeon]